MPQLLFALLICIISMGCGAAAGATPTQAANCPVGYRYSSADDIRDVRETLQALEIKTEGALVQARAKDMPATTKELTAIMAEIKKIRSEIKDGEPFDIQTFLHLTKRFANTVPP